MDTSKAKVKIRLKPDAQKRYKDETKPEQFSWSNYHLLGRLAQYPKLIEAKDFESCWIVEPIHEVTPMRVVISKEYVEVVKE